MQSGYLNRIYQILNYQISIKKILFLIVKAFTTPKTYINKLDIKDNIKTNELNIEVQNLQFKSLPTFIVLWREETINFILNFNKNTEFFKFSHPKINLSPSILDFLVWKNILLNFDSILRKYPVHFLTKTNFLDKNLLVINKTNETNKIDESLIELNRKLRVTEEIVEIYPFIHTEKSQKLAFIPIIKKPLFKSYFSEEEINLFKELLAKQGKTNKINVEITSIYDKFSLDIFSSIKQDVSTKNLICHLNQNLKSNTQNNKMYYLVIGTKKSDNSTIKTVVPMTNN